MHNLYANFVRNLGVCKQFLQDLVNEHGNAHSWDVVPKLSDQFNIKRNYAMDYRGSS